MTESRLHGPRSGFRYVLGQRDFRLIWFAQVAAQLADKFLMFSLIILAYRVSGANTGVAITLLAYTLPAVAIAPLAGVFADRYNRKRLMVWTNLVRAVLIALIPLASLVPALRGEYIHLLVLTFAFSAVGQLFSPAEAAAIPTVISKEALITANSMVLGTMVLTLVLGAPLAPIVSRVEIYAPYWIATGLFLAAGGLIALARIPSPDRVQHSGERHPFKQLAVELREGMAVLTGSPVLLLAFAELALAVLVMFMMFTLAPGYVTHVLGVAEQDTYLIVVPATIGTLVSAAVLGQLGRRWNRAWLLIAALVATGLTLLALAGLPAVLRHFVALQPLTRGFGASLSLLLGLEFGALMIPALSALMEGTDESVRGRVFALLFMVVNGVSAIPVLLGAVLSDVFGTDRVIGALGVLLVAAGVLSVGYVRRVYGTARPPRSPATEPPHPRIPPA